MKRVDRLRRLGKPIASGKTGIEPRGLPGEQQQGDACQKNGKPWMGDDHLSPFPPAVSGTRGPMRIQLRRKGHAAGIDPPTEQRQQSRNEGICQQHADSRDQKSGDADGTDFADGNGQESQKSDGHRRSRNQERAACLMRGDDRGRCAFVAGANRFAEAADHEQCVVDSQAQAKHGGQILNQNGQVKARGQQAGDRQRGRDGELANGHWNQRGDQAAKS